MTIRWTAAAILVLGFGYGTVSAAPGLQPGMRTMMQQGGREHGVEPGRVGPDRRIHRQNKRTRRMMRRKGGR